MKSINLLLISIFFLSVPIINFLGFSNFHAVLGLILFIINLDKFTISRKYILLNAVILFYLPSVLIQLVYAIINNDSIQSEHTIVFGVLIYSILGNIIGKRQLISFENANLLCGAGFSLILSYVFLTLNYEIIDGRLVSNYVSLNFIGPVYFIIFFISTIQFIYKENSLNFFLIGLPAVAYLVLQGARKELISLLICLSWFALITKDNKSLFRSSFVYSFFSIAFLIFFYLIFERYQDIDINLLNVFLANNDDPSSNSRKLEYLTSFDSISNYPIGLGLGNVRLAISLNPNIVNYFGETQHADNFWVESIYMYGIFGPILLAILYFNIFKTFILSKNFNNFYIPITLFLLSFFVNYSHHKILFCLLCLYESDYVYKKYQSSFFFLK